MQIILLLFSVLFVKIKCEDGWKSISDYKVDIHPINPSNNQNPKSVNLALETSFLLEPKDFKHNLNFITNIKSFLDKITKMLEPPSPAFKTKDGETTTDKEKSVNDIKQAIYKLSNSQWGDIYKTIVTEYEKLKNKSKTRTRSGNNNVDSVVSDIINRISDITLTDQFKKLLQDYAPLVEGVQRRLNDVFSKDDGLKPEKIVDKVRRFVGKHNSDISKILDDVITYGLEKYDKLDAETKGKIEKGFQTITNGNSRANEKDEDGMSVESQPRKKNNEIYEVLMDNLEFFIRPQLINM